MGDPKQVKAVIKSIKEFSNFKQMAEYNISCLLTYITPPTVGWRENVAAAVEDGGIESIIGVLKKHGKDGAALDMVKQAAVALTGLSKSKENAGRVAAAGGIETAVECMLKIKVKGKSELEVIHAGAKLMEQIANKNPESIIKKPKTVAAMLKGVQHPVPAVQTASAKVLDSIAKYNAGEEVIVSQGGIKALINAIGPDKETHSEMLMPIFRLLERMAKNPEYVAEMRKNKAVEALVAQLEKHSDNEYLLNVGGRLLAKIADADIEDTIKKLGGKLSDGVRQHLVGLLANLALQPENVEKIVANGGIEALLKHFDSYNPETKAAALKALQRIAETGAVNAQKIIDAGGLPIIINALKTAGGNEEILKWATKALTSIAAKGLDQANLVSQAGGIEAVLQQMLAHPNLENFTVSGLEFISKLCDVGYPVDELVKLGAVNAIFAVMRAGLMNPEVQEKSFEALSSLMSTNNDKNNALSAREIASQPDLAVLCQSLVAHKAVKDVVKAGVDTFAKLGSTEIQSVKGVNGLAALLEAVYEQMKREMLGQSRLSADVQYIRNVKGLLAKLVEKQTLTAVAKNVAGKSADKEALLKQVAVFSLNNDFALIMQNKGVCKALVQSLSSVTLSLIPAHAVATWSLSKTSLETMGELLDTGCVKSLLSAAKNNSKEAEPVIAVLRCMIPFAASKDYKQRMIDLGTIETSVTAMRSNAQDHVVTLASIDLQLALGSTDVAASNICYKGGSAQVNKMIKESFSSTEFELAIERGLQLLYRIASVQKEDVRTRLSSQGTVNNVTSAMSAFPTNEEILETGAKILSLLLSPEDVAGLIEDIKKLTEELKTAKKIDKVFEKLGQKTATLGFVSLNPANQKVLVEKEAAQVVDKSIAVSKSKPLSIKREVAVMNEYRALGQISSVLGPQLGVVDKFLNDLSSKDNVTSLLEKVGILEGIKYLCNNDRGLGQLHQKGAIKIITKLLSENRSDERFLQAALDALTALMKNAKGVELATSAGTGDLVFGILKDDGEQITSKAATSAMNCLSKYCKPEKNTQKLLDEGVVDTVTNILSIHCENSDKARPDVVSKGALLLKNLVVTDKSGVVADQIVKKGALKKIIDVCENSPEYLADDACMQNVTELLEVLCQDEELRPKIRELGAVEFVMAAMNMNPGNEALENCGQRVLQKLVGGDAKALEQTLLEYDRLLNNVKKHPKGNVPAMQRLNRAQVNLKNLMMINGVVDPKGAAQILTRAVETFEVVDKIPDKVGPIKETVLDLALDTIGKTTLIEGAMETIDLEKALGLLGTAIGNDSPELQVQALKALGVLLAEDPSVVKSAVKMGLIQKLQEVMNTTTSPEVKEAAQKAFEAIKKQVMADPKIILIDSPANDEALAAIIKGISDPKDLEDFLKKIASSELGANALMRLALSNLGHENGNLSPDARRAVLNALGNAPPGLLKIPPATVKDLLDLLGNGKVSPAEKAALLKILGDLPLTPQTAKVILDNNGIETLLEMLSGTSDPLLIQGALNALGHFATDPMLAKKLLDLNGEQQIVDVMKLHSGNKEIQYLGFEALANLKETSGGPEKFALSPDALMYLEQALNGLDPGKRKRADQLVEDLSNLYNGEVEPMVISRFDNLLEVLNAAKDWRELYDPETGRPYYYNKVTKETTWNKPQALIAAENALRHLEELAKKSPAEIDQAKLKAAIGHFASQFSQPIRLKALAKALAALAANDANRDAMVRNGVLNALIKALNGDNIDREFILAAIALLNQFAKHPVYKEMICKIGGIAALIRIMEKFMKDEEIIEKAEQCLANLAFQSDLCTAEIMKCNGPKAVAVSLKTHKDSIPVTINAMSLISNVMYKNTKNKDEIGNILLERVVQIIRRMYKNADVFTQAGRALGNIAYIDEHSRKIVGLSAVKTLVKAMDHHSNNSKAVKLAVDIMGNFAQTDETPFLKQIKQGAMPSVIATIHFEGGARKIVNVFDETQDLPLLGSCIRCLMNFLNDAEVRRKLIDMDFVKKLFNSLQQHSSDEDITGFCTDAILVLSKSLEGVKAIYEDDGVAILLTQLDKHAGENEESCGTVVETFYNMLRTRTDLSKRVASDFCQQKGIDTLIRVLEAHIDKPEIVKKTLITMIVMNGLREDVSHELAQKGMRVILDVVKHYKGDSVVLQKAFQLIGLLAFEEKNLKIIVQYGGISLIVTAILDAPKDTELVARAVSTLDNIASGSDEHSNIVKQASGEKVILELIKSYERIQGEQSEKVLKACRAARLTLNKIETRKKKRELFFTGNREEVDPLADPLKNHRELLKTGAEVKLWKGNSSRTVHLYVRQDNFQIQWKAPGGKKVIGKIHLKNLTTVLKGRGAHHGKNVKQHNAFTLASAEKTKTYCFACTQAADRDRWHEALTQLKQVHRSGNTRFLKL